MIDKTCLVRLVREKMETMGVSVSELADMMDTSRSVVYRLLDDKDWGVSLRTIDKACEVLELNIEVKLY